MGQKILLVEGDTDKIFFQEMLKKIELKVEVRVDTPKDHKDIEKNGKIEGST